jgi:hypothetical protein
MTQSVWLWYPAEKNKWIYTPPTAEMVHPGPPYVHWFPGAPEPYPGFWYPGQPHEAGEVVSKPLALPPAKTHMIEDLARWPKFGIFHIDQHPSHTWPLMPASKHWVKMKMLGQPTTFYVHIHPLKEDGSIDYSQRQVVKVKPKQNMQQWESHKDEPAPQAIRSEFRRIQTEKELAARATKINAMLVERGNGQE